MYELDGTECSVVKTSTGVRVNGNDFTTEKLHNYKYFKAMSGMYHIYTIDFVAETIVRGPDYGKCDLTSWLSRNDKPMDEWSDEEYPENYEHEGKLYQIIGADRTWPLPELMLDGKIVGHLDTETDTETGASKQVIRWV
jgi:hypothetical protein